MGDDRHAERTLALLSPDVGLLDALEVLRLDDNGLVALPHELGRLTRLVELRLDRNPLRLLPEFVLQLPVWHRIAVLSHCDLTQIPPSVRDSPLTNIEKLSLDHNALPTLPAAFASLTRLTWLDLSHNALANLPAGLCQLPALRTLLLAANPLTDVASLSDALGNLASLRMLSLARCGLTDMPRGLFRLTGLARLDVSGNPLEVLSPRIQCLSSLQALALDDCARLRVIPQQIERLTRLTDLSLRGALAIEEPPYHVVVKGGAAVLLYVRVVGLGGRKGALRGPRVHRDWNTLKHRGRWGGVRPSPERLKKLLAAANDGGAEAAGNEHSSASCSDSDL